MPRKVEPASRFSGRFEKYAPVPESQGRFQLIEHGKPRCPFHFAQCLGRPHSLLQAASLATQLLRDFEV